MGIVDDFILSIKNKEGLKFDGQVADLINIDRRVLANYKHKDSLPFKLQEWYCNKYDIELKDFYKEIKLTNTDIQLEGDDSMDARYVIELQKDKIENQTVEINTLKEALKKKQAESSHWDALPYDFISDVTLKRKGLSFGRTIDSITNLERQSSVLGYSVNELKKYWSIGKFYNFNEHPVDKIISKETLKEINKQITTLPYIFDSLKSMVGDHYIPQPLMYINKNGEIVGAIAYAKVQWKTLKVTAKVQFLIHMPSD